MDAAGMAITYRGRLLVSSGFGESLSTAV